MQGYGPASESLRLAEHYRQMTDGELISLSEDPSDLTEMAQDALSQEISSRRLRTLPPKPPAIPKPPPDRPEEGSPYAEERKLIPVTNVYSLRDALQVQRILDVAGIPFYMGPEKATGVDAVTSNYAEGIEVKVMQIGVPWALSALTRSYEPKDEPPEEQVEWDARSRSVARDAAPTRLSFNSSAKMHLWEGRVSQDFNGPATNAGMPGKMTA